MNRGGGNMRKRVMGRRGRRDSFIVLVRASSWRWPTPSPAPAQHSPVHERHEPAPTTSLPEGSDPVCVDGRRGGTPPGLVELGRDQRQRQQHARATPSYDTDGDGNVELRAVRDRSDGAGCTPTTTVYTCGDDSDDGAHGRAHDMRASTSTCTTRPRTRTRSRLEPPPTGQGRDLHRRAGRCRGGNGAALDVCSYPSPDPTRIHRTA